MNLGYIRGLARKRLGETTAAFWQDSELNGYANDGIQDIAYRTKCIVTFSQFSAFANLSSYTLQAALPICFAVTEAYFYNVQTGFWYKLRSTSRTELDETNPGWMSVPPSLPYQFWWDREMNLFYLYPAPLASYVSANCVKCYYSTQAQPVVNDTDIPQIPQPIHLAIVDYIVAFAFETRGFGDKANDAWMKYYKRLNDYDVERGREREDDNVISKNYKNRIRT